MMDGHCLNCGVEVDEGDQFCCHACEEEYHDYGYTDSKNSDED